MDVSGGRRRDVANLEVEADLACDGVDCDDRLATPVAVTRAGHLRGAIHTGVVAELGRISLGAGASRDNENTGDAQGHGEGETGSAHCGYLLGRRPDSLVLRNAIGRGLRPLDAQNDDQSLSHGCAISALHARDEQSWAVDDAYALSEKPRPRGRASLARIARRRDGGIR